MCNYCRFRSPIRGFLKLKFVYYSICKKIVICNYYDKLVFVTTLCLFKVLIGFCQLSKDSAVGLL